MSVSTLSDLPEFLQPHPYKVMARCKGWPRPYCYGEFQGYASARERARMLEAHTRDWRMPFTSWVVYDCRESPWDEGEREAA